MAKYIKIFVINLAVLAVLLELLSFIYVRTDGAKDYWFKQTPTYFEVLSDSTLNFHKVLNTFDTIFISDPLAPRVIDTLYPWCTWHPINVTHRGQSDCFDVNYAFDSLGVRGSTPEKNNNNTIIFLGDSFTEGYGLNTDSTISERVKKASQLPVINLGCSGAFGTTQMSLVYDYFSNKYAHNRLYILLFLNNDFIDNNLDKHASTFKKRYRPYRVLKGDSSLIVYKGSMQNSELTWEHFNKMKNSRYFKLKRNFPDAETFIKRIFRLSYSNRAYLLLRKVIPNELLYSQNDLNILKYDMKNIIATAHKSNVKSITFINLPSLQLFDIISRTKSVEKKYLELEAVLKNEVEEHGARYASFYNYVTKKEINYWQMFFDCDAHYSNYGTHVLNDFISNNIEINRNEVETDY